ETVCTGPRQKLDFLRIFNCLTANTFTFGSQNSTGQTPAASRFSIVRPSVSTICHLCPESQLEGYPGSRIKISDSTYQIHTDCDTYTTKNLGHVINGGLGTVQGDLRWPTAPESRDSCHQLSV